jgi:hypothetical protein
MRELGGREAEAGGEGQIEQQFKRGGDPVRLVGIASPHLPGMMMEGLGAGRCGIHAKSSVRDVERNLRRQIVYTSSGQVKLSGRICATRVGTL